MRLRARFKPREYLRTPTINYPTRTLYTCYTNEQMKEKLNTYFLATKAYLVKHSEAAIGIAIVASLGIVALVVVLVVQNATPRIVYQPAKACDLLTLTEANELFDGQAIRGIAVEPKQTRNVAASRCGYSDSNPDANAMRVAAIIVRSGINDAGVEQNKREFEAGKPSEGVENVTGIGDTAYFNQKLGQLNVLDGRNWIVLSYGVGATPETNTVEDVVTFARKVIAQTES